MKNFLTLGLLLLLVFGTSAQDNDSTHYINGLPVSEDDTAQVIADDPPFEKRMFIEASGLPKPLLKQLDNKAIYSGWRKDSVFYDDNTKLYIIRVRENGRVRVYGMDREGRPVTYDEHDQQ